jgi:triosephosphate isomerase
MRLVIANWKMNLNLEGGVELAREVVKSITLNEGCQVVVCPSFIMLDRVSKVIEFSQVRLGGQDCGFADHGAYTGDVSAAMLASVGCKYVILGHSERRGYYHESSSTVRQKAIVAQKCGLVTVICVGESLQEKQNGDTYRVLEQQLRDSIPQDSQIDRLVLAYEPIWAIGTGKIPNMEEIRDVTEFICAFVRDTFSFENPPPILYGGSVTPHNIQDITEIKAVSGVLVGGASLIVKDFKAIVEVVCKQSS